MKEKHGKLKDEHVLHKKNGINSGAGKLFVSYFFLYMISITKLTTTKNARIIGSYLRSWERPGDLPRVIEMLCLFSSGAQRNERKETTISITSGRSPGRSQQRM
jgi:hypothetical protein